MGYNPNLKQLVFNENRTVSPASSQSRRRVDAHAWCKRALMIMSLTERENAECLMLPFPFLNYTTGL